MRTLIPVTAALTGVFVMTESVGWLFVATLSFNAIAAIVRDYS